jgi:hypothetical protein
VKGNMKKRFVVEVSGTGGVLLRAVTPGGSPGPAIQLSACEAGELARDLDNAALEAYAGWPNARRMSPAHWHVGPYVVFCPEPFMECRVADKGTLQPLAHFTGPGCLTKGLDWAKQHAYGGRGA